MDVRSPVGPKPQLGVCSEHGMGFSANHQYTGRLAQLASNNTKQNQNMLDSTACKGEIVVFS